MNPPIVHVVRHAVDRFRERCRIAQGMPDEEAKRVIRGLWHDGVDIGRQKLTGRTLRRAVYRKNGEPLVLVWTHRVDGSIRVYTVLTARQGERTARRHVYRKEGVA